MACSHLADDQARAEPWLKRRGGSGGGGMVVIGFRV